LIRKSFENTGITTSDPNRFNSLLRSVLENEELPSQLLVDSDLTDDLIGFEASEGSDSDSGLDDEEEESDDEDGAEDDEDEDRADDDEDGPDEDSVGVGSVGYDEDDNTRWMLTGSDYEDEGGDNGTNDETDDDSGTDSGKF